MSNAIGRMIDLKKKICTINRARILNHQIKNQKYQRLQQIDIQLTQFDEQVAQTDPVKCSPKIHGIKEKEGIKITKLFWGSQRNIKELETPVSDHSSQGNQLTLHQKRMLMINPKLKTTQKGILISSRDHQCNIYRLKKLSISPIAIPLSFHDKIRIISLSSMINSPQLICEIMPTLTTRKITKLLNKYSTMDINDNVTTLIKKIEPILNIYKEEMVKVNSYFDQ